MNTFVINKFNLNIKIKHFFNKTLIISQLVLIYNRLLK